MEKRNTQKKTALKFSGVVVVAVLVFLLANNVIEQSKTFEYEGLTFVKENFGSIPMYKYTFFTSPVTGNVIDQNQQINLFLRIDPRENNVPVDGKIEYEAKNKFLYISTNETNILQCEHTTVGISSLTAFLAQNGFNVKGAFPDESLAQEREARFVDCETNPENTVILIQEGEESSIIKQDACYTLNIASCEEVLSVFEKFMTQSIIDAKIRKPI